MSEVNLRRSPIEAYNYLNSLGKIYLGSIVTKEEIEDALGIKYKEGWEFRGPLLDLLEVIKDKMFTFVTQRDLEEPAFRILTSAEQSHYGETNLAFCLNKAAKTCYILSGHDTSRLDEDKKKEHTHVQERAFRISSYMQREFFKGKIL